MGVCSLSCALVWELQQAGCDGWVKKPAPTTCSEAFFLACYLCVVKGCVAASGIFHASENCCVGLADAMCVLWLMLWHPCYGKLCLQKKTSVFCLFVFFLNIAFKVYYKLKKRFVLEVFHHWFSVDESKLHTCWITAKVFICFLLGLWLGFLFDIPVEQIVFITVFQSSKTYQQHTFAGFPCWCKHYLVLWGVGVGIGYDSCGAFKTSNSKFSR